MAVAARLAFRDSWGRLCIRRRKRKHRERQQNQCRRADECTHNRKYDRFRILHCNSPVCPNILRKPIPGRTDHNGMAAPGNARITGVYASRAAGGVTGISEITSKTGISLPRDNRRFGSLLTFGARSGHVRYSPNRYQIAALRRTSKGPIAASCPAEACINNADSSLGTQEMAVGSLEWALLVVAERVTD